MFLAESAVCTDSIQSVSILMKEVRLEMLANFYHGGLSGPRHALIADERNLVFLSQKVNDILLLKTKTKIFPLMN